MMRFKIFKLRFTSPLHIGNLRDDLSVSQKTIHSDTLHAALLSCLAKTGRAVPADGDIGCVISDLFPYYQQTEESKPIYFLPMPLQTSMPQLSDPADAKKVKKVQWVDATLYSQILNGNSIFSGSEEQMRMIKDSFLTAEQMPTDASGAYDFVRSDVIERASIADRTGNGSSMPFYVDRISFRDYAGLYFLVRESDDTTLLEEALHLLSLEGIGTDRSSGYGFFEVEPSVQPLIIDTPADAGHSVSLSMLIPDSEEQLNELLSSPRVSYDFSRRGGWITSAPYTTLRKKAIYAFLPGSVFHCSNSTDTSGCIVNLQPEDTPVKHPVWRNGKSLMLPIK